MQTGVIESGESRAGSFFSTPRPLAPLPCGGLRSAEAGVTESELVKVLKVLNFSGAGTSTNVARTFTRTFTGGVAEGPDPSSAGRSLLGDGDALGLARGVERAAPDIGGVRCLRRSQIFVVAQFGRSDLARACLSLLLRMRS